VAILGVALAKTTPEGRFDGSSALAALKLVQIDLHKTYTFFVYLVLFRAISCHTAKSDSAREIPSQIG
jgi:hypothetical protein